MRLVRPPLAAPDNSAWKFAVISEPDADEEGAYRATLKEGGPGAWSTGREVAFYLPDYVDAEDVSFAEGTTVKLLKGYGVWWLDGAGCEILSGEAE